MFGHQLRTYLVHLRHQVTSRNLFGHCIFWYCDLYCREITYVFVGSQNSWSEPSSVGNVSSYNLYDPFISHMHYLSRFWNKYKEFTEDSRLFLFIRPYLEATLGSFCLIQVLSTCSSLHFKTFKKFRQNKINERTLKPTRPHGDFKLSSHHVSSCKEVF